MPRDVPLPPPLSTTIWDALNEALPEDASESLQLEIAAALFGYDEGLPETIPTVVYARDLGDQIELEMELENECLQRIDELQSTLRETLECARDIEGALVKLPSTSVEAVAIRHRIAAVVPLRQYLERVFQDQMPLEWWAGLLEPPRGRGNPGNRRRQLLELRTANALERHGIELTAHRDGVLATVLREVILPAADLMDGKPRRRERRTTRRVTRRFNRPERHLRRLLAARVISNSHETAE